MRLARRWAIGVALGLIAWIGCIPAAHADGVPADPNASGYIGFCDGHGHNVTSGWLNAKPFVWTAVASKPAPASMRGQGQNTVLEIYQLRPGTESEEWSGDELTATSFYHKTSAPAAQATRADISLQTITKEFPPEEDGLYELRMYYGRVNHGVYSVTYPATFIRVTGDTWQVVKGGKVDCAKPDTISNEVLTGVIPAAQALPPPPAKPVPAPVTTAGGGTSTAAIAGGAAGGAVLIVAAAVLVVRTRRKATA